VIITRRTFLEVVASVAAGAIVTRLPDGDYSSKACPLDQEADGSWLQTLRPNDAIVGPVSVNGVAVTNHDDQWVRFEFVRDKSVLIAARAAPFCPYCSSLRESIVLAQGQAMTFIADCDDVKALVFFEK
jgi:hypothetical protein